MKILKTTLVAMALVCLFGTAATANIQSRVPATLLNACVTNEGNLDIIQCGMTETHVESLINGEVDVLFVDPSGNTLLEDSFGGAGTYVINTAELPSGTYKVYATQGGTTIMAYIYL